MQEHRAIVSKFARAGSKGLMACLSLGMLLGCQSLTPNTVPGRGSLRISVQFPKPGFSTKLLKPETRAIYVAIYRNDLSNEAPLVYGPITPENPQLKLNQLPVGEQTVIAAAYDESRHILTAGHSLTMIQANSVTQASLELGDDYAGQLKQAELDFLQHLQLQPTGTALLGTDLQPQTALAGTSVVFNGTQTQSEGQSQPANDAAQTQNSATPAITPAMGTSTSTSSLSSVSANSSTQAVPVNQPASTSQSAPAAEPAPATQPAPVAEPAPAAQPAQTNEPAPAAQSAPAASSGQSASPQSPGNSQADKDKADKEKADKAKADKEKADKEKADKEKADKEKADKAKADKEKADKDKSDKDKKGSDHDDKSGGNSGSNSGKGSGKSGGKN